MNEPVLFLLGAVALSALGGLIVWVLSRPRREKFGSTINSFSRDLNALAPPGQSPNRKRQRPAGLARPQGTKSNNASNNGANNGAGPRPNPVEQRGNQAHSSGSKRPNKVVQTTPRPRPGPRPRQGQQ